MHFPLIFFYFEIFVLLDAKILSVITVINEHIFRKLIALTINCLHNKIEKIYIEYIEEK